MAVTFTDNNFEKEVLQSDKPVLVDFYADWCGPCKMIAPIIEQLAEEYADKVKVGKLNVDADGGTAQKYKVMSIPTLLIFNKGEVVDNIVGVVPKEELTAKLDSL